MKFSRIIGSCDNLSTFGLKKSLQSIRLFQCLLCNQACNNSLCEACENSFIHNETACPICAQPLKTKGICGECQKHKPYFNRTIAPLIYSYPFDHLLWEFKYFQKPEYAQLLTKPLVERLRSEDITTDQIVPVPLHPKRQRERGYNQSLLIANILSKKFNIPINLSCYRQKETAVQSLTKFNERKKNVKDAFATDADFKGQSIVIVDDVITSGATVNELAKLLKRKGAKKIHVWALVIRN